MKLFTYQLKINKIMKSHSKSQFDFKKFSLCQRRTVNEG